MILFENLWERTLREIAGRHGGKLAGQRLVGSDALGALGRALGGT